MTQNTLHLILFLAPLAWSPGPGNVFFAASGARFGFRATVSANLGYHAATLLVTLAIGLGFEWITERAPLLLGLIKYAGAAYVLYLAWGLARTGALHGDAMPRPAGFPGGVALLILNPKAYLIIALIFTQFTGKGAGAEGSGVMQVAWIALVFTLNNLVAFSAYAALGDRMMARWRHPETARRLNIGLAVVLAAVALWMLRA